MYNLMTGDACRGTNVYRVIVEAPVSEVFESIRDVGRWTEFMPAVVSGSFVTAPAVRASDTETVFIRAEANDQVHEWHSARTVDVEAHRIRFMRLEPHHPLLEMRGQWDFEPQDRGLTTEVTLRHSFATADEKSLDFYRAACVRNAATDLEGLRAFLAQPATGATR